MNIRDLIREAIHNKLDESVQYRTIDHDVKGSDRWKPLYAFLTPIFGENCISAAKGFMFMQARQLRGGPEGGIILFWYKHGITRRYVVLDGDGDPYSLRMAGDDYDEVADLLPQTNEDAYRNIYGDLGQFLKDHPNAPGLDAGVLTDYSSYKKWRDDYTAANGIGVRTIGRSDLNEEKKNREQKLKDNKVKLTDNERVEIITKGATWTDGKPGIWKSVDKNGKVTYCSNTHRAMSISTSLAAAIKKFPFIKSTA